MQHRIRLLPPEVDSLKKLQETCRPWRISLDPLKNYRNYAKPMPRSQLQAQADLQFLPWARTIRAGEDGNAADLLESTLQCVDPSSLVEHPVIEP